MTTDNTPQTDTAKKHTENHTTIPLINRQYMLTKWSARVIIRGDLNLEVKGPSGGISPIHT